MARLTLKKKLVAGGLAAASLATASVAFAYWSTSGSGSGSGTTASGYTTAASGGYSFSNAAITGLVPGGSAQPVEVTVKNNNVGATSAGAVTVSIGNPTRNGVEIGGPCGPTNFALVDANGNDAPMVGGLPGSLATTTGGNPEQGASTPGKVGTLASGASVAVGGVKVRMISDGFYDQNGCKGATVVLSYSLAEH
jgi:hypothetical protein